MRGLVNISTTELVNVCSQCIEILENYNGEDDENQAHRKFSLLKFRTVNETHVIKPIYIQYKRSVKNHLEELMQQAYCVEYDSNLAEELKYVQISLMKHNELYKLLNKDKNFQPIWFTDY